MVYSYNNPTFLHIYKFSVLMKTCQVLAKTILVNYAKNLFQFFTNSCRIIISYGKTCPWLAFIFCSIGYLIDYVF